MNSAKSKKSEMILTFEPAECWQGCTEPNCPYIHKDLWCVYGSDKIFIQAFRTKEEAVAFMKQTTEI